MPSDLIVNQGTTLVLNEDPPTNIAEALEKVQIRTLNDLADSGIISSRETVSQLLGTAKRVTAEALALRETFVPFVAVPGTTRPDLRRFGGFLANSPDVSRIEAETFWRLVRPIDPHMLAELDLDAPVIHLPRHLSEIFRYLFANVTVEPESTLVIASSRIHFNCGHLLIRRTGRIVVQGSAVFIKATSIQGEQ
jgi:hypothetical protein